MSVEKQKHFVGLVKLQVSELMSTFKMKENDVPTTFASAQASDEPKACTSNTLRTPKSSTSKINLSLIKKFSPLVTDGNKIRCTVEWCKSRFTYKRSYNKHMASFHANVEIDKTVKDPPGKCELLTAGMPCHTTLCERAMLYHMTHIHGINVPANHFLYGFDTSSNVPAAVFVPDTHRQEAKKTSTSTVNMQNAIVIPQSVKKCSKRLYPNICSTGDIESISDDSIDTTPKPPKAKKPKRMQFLRSSSESSFDRSLNYLEDNGQSLATAENVSNNDNNCEHINQPVLTPEDTSKDVTNKSTPPSEPISIEDDDIYQALTQEISPVHFDGVSDSSSQALSIEKEKQKTPCNSSGVVDNEKSSNHSSFRSSDSKSSQNSEADTTDTDSEESSSNSSQSEKDFNTRQNERFTDIDNLSDTSLSDDNYNFDDISQDIQEPHDDSDIEDGDDELYTSLRRRNRELRYNKRNIVRTPLYNRDENKFFIEDFKSFLLNFSVKRQTTSTINKACSHLFFQQDSLLFYEYGKSSDFNLEKFRAFASNDLLLHVRYPGDWLNDTTPSNGNKGLDRLKSHCDLREFIEYSADKYSGSHEFSASKQVIRENLQGIKLQISNAKLFRKYNILSNSKQQERKNAKMILDSSRSVNLEQIIKTWNSSLEKEELERDFDFMYQNCMDKGSISIKMLTQYSQYARTVLLMSDKNRGGVYQFTCRDFVNRIPCYFPDGYDGFNSLPHDWNPLVKPPGDPKPTTWMINLPGR